MFLMRMCLGHVYLTQQQTTTFVRPPCRTCCTHACVDKSHGEMFHTVMADGGQFSDREFVVYDQNQTYPEYIIKFKY